MKNILVKKVWPVVLGFASASFVIMVFEYINSLFYPFPKGFNERDMEQIKSFILSAPDTIYILVMLGWLLGGVVGSIIILKISDNSKVAKNLLIVLATLLTLGAIFNNYYILQGLSPWWMNLYGLVVFPLIAIYFIKYRLK